MWSSGSQPRFAALKIVDKAVRKARLLPLEAGLQEAGNGAVRADNCNPLHLWPGGELSDGQVGDTPVNIDVIWRQRDARMWTGAG